MNAESTGRRSALAPTWRAILALAIFELRLSARRGENLLVTIVIPAVVLVFFTAIPIRSTDDVSAVVWLLPGAIALAVIATGMVSLGIATAYERSYGVLKRLGGAPIDRATLPLAKILSVLALEALQVALLVAIAALFLGWAPGPGWSPALVLVGLLLGTAAFAGLGLAMAGTLRAEATMAVSNGLFLACLLLGGIVVPLDRLPDTVATFASLLPAAALAETLRIGLGASSGDPTGPLLVLTGWAVGSVAVAIRAFRWD
jgi:ABC-2 type transport system permease protein